MRKTGKIIKKGKMYEGKAKIVYKTNIPSLVIQEFKDDATAFDGKKKGTIGNKGICNIKISSIFFKLLSKYNIPTHYIKSLNDREMLIKKLKIIPVEVVARNIAAGSLSKRLGLPEGTVLKKPVIEFYYKNDELGDPMINEYHIDSMGFASVKDMQIIKRMASKINEILRAFLRKKGLLLIDFKLEFGKQDGKIFLADEISPDTCRFWDIKTKEKLDKDRFRRDLGRVEEAYQEVLKRLQD